MAAGMAGPSGARREARERPGSSGNREVVSAVGRAGEMLESRALGGGGQDILAALWPAHRQHLAVTENSRKRLG